MIPGSANPLLLASAAAAGGYAIERSLRFNSSDSAYLSRTPASAGNRKTWTWAGWVKRSGLTRAYDNLFCNFGSDGNTISSLFFNSDNTLIYAPLTASLAYGIVSSAVFRDTSAWYHIACVSDTTNATASERCRLYVNGQRLISLSSASYPPQNYDTFINQASVNHAIGNGFQVLNTFFNGYLADIHFIDGQALTPTSFGEFDTNGIWQPIAYTGTYGTNGFHLDFADNASTTTIGYDAAGSNDWTANNLSVTAGAGNDSLVDVPTNGAQTDTGAGGEVRGNYCTWNAVDKSSNVTLSNGNLDTLHGGAGHTKAVGNIYVSSGKWYAEFTLATQGGAVPVVGINSITLQGRNTYVGSETGSFGYSVSALKYSGSAPAGTAYGATFTAGDVIGVALDLDTGTLVFYKNGASQGTAFTGVSGTYTFAVSGIGISASWVANFGQRPFAYTAPSGFKALNTANLPAPVVTKPSTVMDVALYTGTGSALTPTSSLGFNPDLVWIKGRSGATDHALYDSVRGVEKRLESNTTDAEVTSDGGVTAFNTAGFSVGTLAQVNTSSATYAAWTWDAGSSTVTNTQGSISSQVRANASAGFSVVTYTGTGSAATVGHGLGVAPAMVIIKSRTTSDFWVVGHTSLGFTTDNYLRLNATSSAEAGGGVAWNNTAPTSTVVHIGSSSVLNGNGNNLVMYAWAPLSGYSSMGSYVGNGQTSGVFVYTGFRPRWVLIKKSSSTGSWYILDTARDTYNQAGLYLYPDLSNAEDDQRSVYPWDILSNGFIPRAASGSVINDSGATYIYFAIAEHPFQYARAR
jgi:hypothetical protein